MKYSNIKLTLILVFSLQSIISFSQGVCDCDSPERNSNYSGYCIEYLDIRWNPVDISKAQFKRYIWYSDGKRARTPASKFMNQKIFLNNKEIRPGKAVAFLNGTYQILDDKGKVVGKIKYQNGHLK